jgi:methionine-rich copper-binding protein CopC
MMKTRTIAAAVAAALLAVPPLALGHTELKASTPKKGATVSNLPGQIVLTFEEPISKVITARVLHDGSHRHDTRARLNPRNPAQVLIGTRDDHAGPYRVIWRILGDDGHVAGGSLSFTVKG